MNTDDNTCHICGNSLTAEVATCNNCERPFHLRQREDSEGADCGEVWISEQHLSLEFACNACLGKSPDLTQKHEPPVHRQH
ncbi:MAG: hypothetical protein ABI559_12725 [Chloroflexota bacterium]